MSQKAAIKNTILDVGVYLVMCVATFLMLKTITGYLVFRDDVQFLKEKQPYLHIGIWKAAFYTHVFSSIFTLVAGFTQFSNYILKHYKKLHRTIGKMYVVAVLFINFPAGLMMAYYANGGLPSKIAFTILDCLWFWFTYKAVLEIKRRNIVAHRQYMIRSYALTFSAITLRSWKIVLSSAFIIDPATLYRIDAWMGFVPNLLLAEWLIWQMKTRKKTVLPAKVGI